MSPGNTSDKQEHVADTVILGAGVIGASIAMQLAMRGQRVIVLERALAGSGSTGRAAGLLGQLRSTREATRMLVDGLEIVRDLERRTESHIFVQTGSLRVAQTPARAREIEEHVKLGREVGLPVEHIGREEVARLLPYMKVDDLLDACYCPTDGHLQPAELLAAYIAVAREHGARFIFNAPVEQVHVRGGRVAGVRAAGHRYDAGTVVNSTGPWSYLVTELAESRLPTAAIAHVYLTTTPSDAVVIDRHSPAVRDRENRIYSRPEAGGLIVGTYEAQPVEYDMEQLPADFDMASMRPRRDDLTVATLIDAASRRFPFIGPQTPMTITQGIMTFTPDGRPFCGPDAEIEGLFHASGFCGHGIVQSPTIGRIMAEWIVDGRPTYDVSEIEADRYADVPELADRATVKARCRRTYADYYGKVVAVDSA